MEQTTVTQESKGFYKLNWLQRIGFGSGDLAQNLIYQTIMYVLVVLLYRHLWTRSRCDVSVMFTGRKCLQM